MVEMTETANILHNATDKSLVLMDEVGRGTSTFDGLSLAWASAVYLASQVKAYTLFATHYFELTALSEHYPQAHNIHLDATEHNDHIVFLHSIQEGPASKSYGLQVAKLAGIPDSVVAAAKIKLASLENTKSAPISDNAAKTTLSIEPAPTLPEQPDMFSATHPAIDKLNATNPDDLSPKAALELLYALKNMVN